MKNLNKKTIIRLIFSCFVTSLIVAVFSIIYKQNFILLVEGVKINPLYFLGIVVTNSLWSILYIVFLLELYNCFDEKLKPTLKILKSLTIGLVILIILIVPTVMILYTNTDHCENMTGDKKISCLVNLAIIRNNPGECEFANTNSAPFDSSDCYSRIAGIANQTFNDCNLSSSSLDNISCIENIAISSARIKKEPSICESMNTELKNFVGEPIISADGRYEIVTNQSLINDKIYECYNSITRVLNNKSVCNNIKDTDITTKQNCMDYIKKYTQI